MRLFHLAYVSRATIEIDEAELQRIRESARRRNSLIGVTGLLLWSRGHFLQLLEGDASSLASLYERIEQDPRHTDVANVYFGPAPRRFYGDWAMGVFDLEKPAPSIDPAPLWSIMNDRSAITPRDRQRRIIEAFERFRIDLEKQAA